MSSFGKTTGMFAAVWLGESYHSKTWGRPKAGRPQQRVRGSPAVHNALFLKVTGWNILRASRYRASERPFPETLPPLEYAPDMQVRRGSIQGVIKFDSRSIRIGRAFCGELIGVRATSTSDIYEVFYAHQSLGQFDGRQTARGSREVLNIHRIHRE